MEFTHLDQNGAAAMVDVGNKNETSRKAVACGKITMSPACYQALNAGNNPKGDVFAAARIAGIMAAKRTSDLIPLCHPLMITKAAVDFRLLPEEHGVEVSCTVSCKGVTGVEMEALTGASVALLTLYDMCKALDKSMVISNLHLVEKHGGKSGDFYFEEQT